MSRQSPAMSLLWASIAYVSAVSVYSRELLLVRLGEAVDATNPKELVALQPVRNAALGVMVAKDQRSLSEAEFALKGAVSLYAIERMEGGLS